MGMFDDLIPAAGAGPAGGGMFDDLIPKAPAKRPIGALEAFGRSMGDSFAAVPDFLNEAAAALLRPVDGAIGSDLAGALTRPTGPVKQARAAYKLDQQTEQLDGAGAQLAQGLGPLPRDLVAAMLTSGFSAPAAATVPTVDAGLAASLKALVPELQQGAKAMMVPGALSSRDAYNEARVAGADPMQSAAVGTVRGVGAVAQGALPMAKAGNMATRVASGIPLSVLPNRVQMQAENLVAPAAMQHQPTPTDDIAAAIPGMVMAGLLGPRAGRSTYGSTKALADPAAMSTDRMRYDTGQERAAADAAQLATDLQTYGPILEANGIDPNSTRAQGVIANLKAREAAKSQTQAESQAETVPPSPEEMALAQRQQPPAVIPVDAAGRADAGEQTIGVKASMLDQGGDAALIDSMARFQREQRGADPLEQTATLQTEQPISGDQYGGRATPYNPNPLDGGRVSGDVLPPDAGTSVVPGGRRAGDTVNGETLRPFDAPNEQRQIGERSRFATDEQGRTVDRENRQPMAGEGRPLELQQTTNEQTTQQTNKPEQQTGAPRALPAPKSEPTPANHVAESKAPAPSEPGDGKVATAHDGAASESIATPINPEQKGAADGQVQKAPQEVLKPKQPAPPDSGTVKADSPAPDEPVKGYAKDQAEKLASSMSKKGLPSESYPHPSGDGTFAIRAAEAPAPKQTPDPDTANPERNLFEQPAPKAADELHTEAEKVRNGLSGPGTLHSNPIGEVIKFLGKITGFTDPEYHAQFKEQTKKIVEAIRSIGKPKEPAENAVAAVARIIAFSNQGRLQTLENIYQSAAIKKLRLLIDRDGGRGTGQGEVYGSALDRNTTKFGNRLYDALGGMKAPELEQLTKLLQNRASIKPGTKLHDAATAVAKLLDDLHAYALDAGVSLGLHKDYFPRVDDTLAIMADPIGYKQALAKAYMKTDPSMSAQDAKAAAEERFKKKVLDANNAVDESLVLVKSPNSTPNQNFAKSRRLSKEADEIMRPYLIQDPVDTLHTYIHKVVRRVEFERRFGGEAMLDGSPLPKSFEKARDQNMAKGMTRAEAVAKAEAEYNKANPGKPLNVGNKLSALMAELNAEGNHAAQESVLGALRSTIGELPAPNTGRGIRTVTSWMQAITVMRYLRHAPFTSLSEPSMAMGATGRLSDVPKAYAGTVADITRRIGQKWLGEDWMKGSSSQNAYDIAKMLGVVGSHAEQMSAMLQQAGGVGEGSRLATQTANKAVHLSGLRAFTDATRVSMTNIGMSFLESISSGALRGEKLDSFHLRDLGLSEAEIPAFAKFVTDTGPMTVGKLTGADKAMAERYGQVLYNLTTKVILAPTSAEKPKFANHQVGRVAYSLMSYMMSFQQNVITPAYRKAKKAAINDEQFTPTERIRLLAPIASLALGGMIQYALLPFRQAMYGTDEDRKKKPKTEGEKIMEAASRAGLAGAADPLFNMAVSAKYERDPATMALGPVGGDVSKLAMDIAKFPTDRNSDNTNTHERQTAKDFYNVIVDPALSLAAQQLLPGPTAVLATQALGHKAVKESFVSAAAGEDKRNSQQQRQW